MWRPPSCPRCPGSTGSSASPRTIRAAGRGRCRRGRRRRRALLHATLRHEKRVEDLLELLLLHDLLLERDVDERTLLAERALHELRRPRIADVGRERCNDEGGREIHELLRARLVDAHAFDAFRAQRADRVRENRRGEADREVDARHHDVQLELPRAGAPHDRGVVADDLEADHVHHLADRRVHLARHDRRARLHRGKDELAEAGLRARHEQPPISCPKVTGTASCRCVRPGFTMFSYSTAFDAKTSASLSSSAYSVFVRSRCASRIAVGVTSFVDCPMFTWSLGLTCSYVPRPPPRIWFARLAITSFATMCIDTPAPEWNGSSPN